MTFELGLKGDRIRTEIVIKHSGKQASIKKVWELVGSEKFIWESVYTVFNIV